MELFVRIAFSFQSLNIFAKRFILNVWWDFNTLLLSNAAWEITVYKYLFNFSVTYREAISIIHGPEAHGFIIDLSVTKYNQLLITRTLIGDKIIIRNKNENCSR